MSGNFGRTLPVKGEHRRRRESCPQVINGATGAFLSSINSGLKGTLPTFPWEPRTVVASLQFTASHLIVASLSEPFREDTCQYCARAGFCVAILP